MSNIPTIGEILYEEFLQPFGLSQNALAKALDVPPNRIRDIVSGKRRISCDTDLRLCRFLGLSDGYFTEMQLDFERIATKRVLSAALQKIHPIGSDKPSISASA